MTYCTENRRIYMRFLLYIFLISSGCGGPLNRSGNLGIDRTLHDEFYSDDDIDWTVISWLYDRGQLYHEHIVKASEVTWTYMTNITEENRQRVAMADIEDIELQKAIYEEASQRFNTSGIHSVTAKRILEEMIFYNKDVSTKDEHATLTNLKAKVEAAQKSSRIEVCDAQECSVQDLNSARSAYTSIWGNTTLMLNAWTAIYDEVGNNMADYFYRAIELESKLNRRSGIKTPSISYTYEFLRDQADFLSDMERLQMELLPFYEDLHTYLRFYLNYDFGDNIVPLDSSIPAHMLGTVHGLDFDYLREYMLPYPDTEERRPSISDKLRSRNASVVDIAKIAEQFFLSIGFPSLPETFWNRSVFEEPLDVDVDCHPVALSVDKGDHRIFMCGDTSEHYLNTLHHEMGHIYYFLAYENQSVWLQDGANSGFHEAVGDLIYLSASSDRYLKQIDLLPDEYNAGPENKLNFLMRQAARKIAFLPISYVADLWRWNLLDGKVNLSVGNSHYWELRKKFQGVHSPVDRRPDGLDAGVIYHVSTWSSMVDYFIATVLQFQFHQALCSPKFDDLVDCTIYGDKTAGEKLWKMLALGKSKPWPEALEMVTGSRRLSVEPILDYFKDLRIWLRTEVKELGLCLGWGVEWPNDVKLNSPRC